MGAAATTPKGGAQRSEPPEYYLEAFVGSKAYNLGSPFWTHLLSVPVNHPWPEERVAAGCAWLARNNRFTGHVVKLLIHVVWSLQEETASSSSASAASSATQLLKAINATRFSRIFLKYFIEVFSADVVDHLQLSDIEGQVAEIRKSDQNVLALLVRSLLGFVGSADVNARTYLLHLEVVNLLLVMMSTQLHAPKVPHPFLETAMQQEMGLVGPFIRKLIVSFIARLPVPSSTEISFLSSAAADGGTGRTAGLLLRRMTSAAATVFLLPYYLVNAKGEMSKSPLADNSLLLLLVLVHNVKLPAEGEFEEKEADSIQPDDDAAATDRVAKPVCDAASLNPFRAALESLRDTNFYPFLQNDGVGGESLDLELDAHVPSSSLTVPFGALYERLGGSIADERSTLLLYSLVQGNAAFLEYIFVRVDLDILLLPLLEILYNASRCSSNQIYMLLIVLLILSQDASFNASVHKLTMPGVPWYKERLLPHISLGSLMVIILIRIVKENLSKLRDVYLHTNCLATLANMAPHCHQLNAYASQCLVTLFDMLARKYTRLSASHTTSNGTAAAEVSVSMADNSSSVSEDSQQRHLHLHNAPPPPPHDEVPTELHIYTDFLRIVLEIINSILTYALPRNPEVIYALLHRQEIFLPHRDNPNFHDLLTNIFTVVHFFSVPLDARKIDGHWSVERVLQLVINNTRAWRADGMKTFTQLRFTYEEELHSEDFFTPYVWQLVVAHSGIPWDSDLSPAKAAKDSPLLHHSNDPNNGESSPLPILVDPATATISPDGRERR